MDRRMSIKEGFPATVKKVSNQLNAAKNEVDSSDDEANLKIEGQS